MAFQLFTGRKTTLKRWVRKTPERKISEFKNGDIAKIKGTVQYLSQTLKSPFYNIRCAHYYTLAEKEYNFLLWTTIFNKESSADIVIYDGHNYAVIQTKKVKSYLVTDKVFLSNIYKGPPESIKAFMAKSGYETTNFLGYNLPIRYKESVLEEGDMLTVVGKGCWVKKEQLNLDIPVENVLYFGNGIVYMTDDPTI